MRQEQGPEGWEATPAPSVPPGLPELLDGLAREVLRNNPTDVHAFCAKHFETLLEIRDGKAKKIKPKMTLEQKIEYVQMKVRAKAQERYKKFINNQPKNTFPQDISQEKSDQESIEDNQDHIKNKNEPDNFKDENSEKNQNDSHQVDDVKEHLQLISNSHGNSSQPDQNDGYDTVDIDFVTVMKETAKKETTEVLQEEGHVLVETVLTESVGSEDENKDAINKVPDKLDDTLRSSGDKGENGKENEANGSLDNAVKTTSTIAVSKTKETNENGDKNYSTVKENSNENIKEPELSDKEVVENRNLEETKHDGNLPEKGLSTTVANITMLVPEVIESEENQETLTEFGNEVIALGKDRSNEHVKEEANNTDVVAESSSATDTFRDNDKSVEPYEENNKKHEHLNENQPYDENIQKQLENENTLQDENIQKQSENENTLQDETIPHNQDSGERKEINTMNIQRSNDEKRLPGIIDSQMLQNNVELLILSDSGKGNFENIVQVTNTERTQNHEVTHENLMSTKNNGSDQEIVSEVPSFIGTNIPGSTLNNLDQQVRQESNNKHLKEENTRKSSEDEDSNVEKSTVYSPNMDLETAAITIQKVFRAFLFKSRASTSEDNSNNGHSIDMSSEASNRTSDSEAEFPKTGTDEIMNTEEKIPETLTRMNTVLQTVNEEKSLSLSTDESLSSAATVIQAHVRGFLVRNRLSANKLTSSDTLAVSEETLDTDTPRVASAKTVLNINIRDQGHLFSISDSIATSVDLPPDSARSAANLHPLGYDKDARKRLTREDAIQSISPPSNSSFNSPKETSVEQTEDKYRISSKDQSDNGIDVILVEQMDDTSLIPSKDQSDNGNEFTSVEQTDDKSLISSKNQQSEDKSKIIKEQSHNDNEVKFEREEEATSLFSSKYQTDNGNKVTLMEQTEDKSSKEDGSEVTSVAETEDKSLISGIDQSDGSELTLMVQTEDKSLISSKDQSDNGNELTLVKQTEDTFLISGKNQSDNGNEATKVEKTEDKTPIPRKDPSENGNELTSVKQTEDEALISDNNQSDNGNEATSLEKPEDKTPISSKDQSENGNALLDQREDKTLISSKEQSHNSNEVSQRNIEKPNEGIIIDDGNKNETEDTNATLFDESSRKSLTDMNSDEKDVITPLSNKNSELSKMASEERTGLLHSSEFHDVLLPTRVVRKDSTIVREFKNVLVYFIKWHTT